MESFLLPSPPPGARWPPGVVLYPTPLTNIVIMSPIHFISHCPLGQHICAFMHWGHDYHSMFPLHLLFAEAGRGHHMGTELMAWGNPCLKRILQTLCHWMTPIQYSLPQIHVFLYRIQVSPLESILGHGRYKDELIWVLSQGRISLRESLVPLKRGLTRALILVSVTWSQWDCSMMIKFYGRG